MADYIPDDKLEEIKDRVSIVEVISDYVSLKKAGKNYKGLCPFHSEKTPSFMVNEEKQIFHCFGCNTGGNVFNFLMKMDRLSFPEAARGLARRYGIDLPKIKISEADKEENLKREWLFELNELAASYYHNLLINEKEGKEAREYLRQRGIGNDVIIDHRVGYAQNSWDGLLKFLLKKGVPLSRVSEVGLIIPKKAQGFYDRFRGRMIFPIININGKVIGFGGRVLDNTLPKYLNSPESSIYNKSNSLYGLKVAKDFIRSEDKVIVVEGYFDLLSLNQYGIKNVAATLGTSLTTGHIRILRRYTNNIITVFDADEAGEKAAARSLDILLKHGASPKIAVLPSGFDPDSFVKKVGEEGFKEIIAGSMPLIEFAINEVIKRHDASSVEGKVKIIEDVTPILAKIENKIERDIYIQRVSNRLGIKEDTIVSQLRKTKKGGSVLQEKGVQFMDEDIVEKLLLKLMLLNNEVVHKIQEEAIIEEFVNKQYKEIGLLLLEEFNRQGRIDSGKVINCLEDENSKSLISQLSIEKESIEDVPKILKDCMNKIRMHKVDEEIKILDIKIKEAEEKKDEVLQREFLISRQELKNKQINYRQAFLRHNNA
ncbi:MAG: DNA primase [Deltaproteobacteria bacterium CG12_big_fil_rev_8_21_14_0_65_43_10]|nr:MAG: DNA primase [Deltaproteobacteria bacterium CG2_30_43_15]PIQ44999.1 MAG: DNA primase [Deltaproteobacteria bacterium CG12_big_fil_rev_8_21_14_0_65_43_10]PIU85778.1 MAG: DNA primase [Deltaproteobacteria bacterium CG06_land_8_20_14_3_00_44_19]PJB44756.1 MAG: DNA primase [Deltaproteobacteria bacterium CG_4_9_14_3_um_filter_44_9]